VLSCVVLYSVVSYSCYAVVYSAILHYIVLYTVMCYTVLNMLYCFYCTTAPYYVYVPYLNVLCCTLLFKCHTVIIWCTVLCSAFTIGYITTLHCASLCWMWCTRTILYCSLQWHIPTVLLSVSYWFVLCGCVLNCAVQYSTVLFCAKWLTVYILVMCCTMQPWYFRYVSIYTYMCVYLCVYVCVTLYLYVYVLGSQ
jgi:hypothetical protein